MNENKQKKILYITSRADFGGGPLHVDDLIKYFIEFYDVYCASPVEPPYGTKWQSELKRFHHFKIPHRKFTITDLFGLISFIKQNNIKLIHAHGKGAGLYARLAKLFIPNLKIIFTFHGFHPDNYGFFSRVLYIWYEKVAAILTDHFINVSYSENKLSIEYKLFDPSKASIIYNGIKSSNPIHQNKVEARKALGLDLDKFTIISANRFDKQKNLILVLNIAKFLTNNKNIIFLLLGDGEQFEIIKHISHKDNLSNIFFMGYKSNVQEFLEASDLYLATSLGEALGYSLIEACRAGLPILATNVRGHNEVVIENYNGFLFELNDAKRASIIIEKLSSESSELIELGLHAKKYYEKNFNINSTYKNISNVYEKF
ncbi:MAG: glycosyltransferase [Ignavibacterium sp.]|jgi:glycosyltransferase involved in cell wall biosynthesis|nr:glycosyltransferase [Ignavibacterium sp.]